MTEGPRFYALSQAGGHRRPVEYSPPMGGHFWPRCASHAVDTRSCEQVRGRSPRYSLGENRLKNRFSFGVSNGDVLQVLDGIGAPEEIRTPDPQIRSLVPHRPAVMEPLSVPDPWPWDPLIGRRGVPRKTARRQPC